VVIYTYEDDEASVNHRICEKLGLEMISWNADPAAAKEAIHGAGLIIDGLMGTGIKGEVRSPVKEVVRAINAAPADVVSVDVPSGIGGAFRREYVCVHAAHTLTIGLPKTFLYLPFARPHCGRIRVLSIGFPRELITWPARSTMNRALRTFFPAFPPMSTRINAAR
jgi:NAD(P)H-hydrate epimerase